MKVRVVLAALALAGLQARVPLAAGGARLFKSGPIQITADGRWVWLVNPDNDSVSRIDTGSEAVTEFALATGDSPRGVSLKEDGSEVWVACHDSDRVVVLAGLGPAAGSPIASIALPWGSGAVSVALSPDQRTALVALHRADALALVAVGSHRLTDILAPVFRSPFGIAWIDDGSSAFVTHLFADRFDTYLTRVDLSGPVPKVASRIFSNTAKPQQDSRLTDPDPSHNVAEGGYLTFRGHLAQIPSVIGKRELWLPTQYANLHQDIYKVPPSSTIQSVVRRLDIATLKLPDTLEDKVVLSATQVHDPAACCDPLWLGPGWDAGISGPVDIGFSRDGRTAYLLNEVSGDLLVMPFDTPAFKPSAATPRLPEIDVGALPMGLAVSPVTDLAYVMNRYGSRSGVPSGRTVSVLDLAALVELRQISVAPEPFSPSRVNGARIFSSSYDPRVSPNQKIGCASCHPGGEQEGHAWDLQATPGLHGVRSSTSLLGIGQTYRPGERDPDYGWGELHRSGDRDEVQDFEHTFKGVMMGGTGFLGAAANPDLGPPNAGLNADLDALAEFVHDLPAVKRSPHRAAGGGLSLAAVRGATFFRGSDPAKPADSGCAGCHDPERGFIDARFHDVGQLHGVGEAELNARVPAWSVNTPSLVGCWISPLYDGVASAGRQVGDSMLSFLEDLRGRGSHGDIRGLSSRQIVDLAEFVQSIDGDMTPTEVSAARDVTPPRIIRVEPVSLTRLNVWFDESVDPASAENVANWELVEVGVGPVAIAAAVLDRATGDAVRLTTLLRGGCPSVGYTLTAAGPILDLAASASGGVANALDPRDPANRRGFAIGDSLTVTLGGSGYESLRIAVHDAGIYESLGGFSFDAPHLSAVDGSVPEVQNKGFIRFEWRAAFTAATGVASAAEILEASFTAMPSYGDAYPIEARRTLLSWSDGHVGDFADVPGAPSWPNHANPSPWNRTGAEQRSAGVEGRALADYDARNDLAFTPDTVAPMAAINERVTFSGPGVSDAFRFWFDHPTVDYGYALQLAPRARTEAVFRSAESELQQDGPVLRITYRLPGTTAGPVPGEVSGRGAGRPLLAVKRPSGLLLSFEDLGAATFAYNLYEGSIGRYYSHRSAGCGLSAAPAPGGRAELLHVAPEMSYVLVTASNCHGEGPSDPAHPPALLDCVP